MEKFFNTAGPIKPELHYYIPFFERLDWEEIKFLIASEKYFLLHAPRQTGKTSALFEMMDLLNKDGRYSVLYANIEGAQVSRNDIVAGIRTVCNVVSDSARIYLQEERLQSWYVKHYKEIQAEDLLRRLLSYWAEISEKPIVLFLDEADALVGDTLISLLRQIRSGYNQRPYAFPQSIVLCGLRDIRDYRIHTGSGEIITGGSAFNIKSESMRLGNFNAAECRALFLQHTDATGQQFADEIFSELWEDTAGQPWLVNALGYELTWKNRAARDRSRPIILKDYFTARENLIQSRATHLDQLTDKLREPRVHGVIAPLLAGEKSELQIPHDDLQYVVDLGLVVRKPQLKIANRIYREIIPRELVAVTQDTMLQESAWYVDSENRLDMTALLKAFQQFFRENSQSWIEVFDYKEAGPQLLLQAFLQRILNGGGRLNREYALGRRRTDLIIEWPLDPEKGYFGPVQKVVLELKILRGNRETLIAEGLKQTAEYADKCNAEEAHLIIFNRDPEIPWDKKISLSWATQTNRRIGIWGM
ncbi:MAG: ATP-binding protein [Deltaproteobacteria bacterium]|nr:ATP-binding protein [Candidatus Tharpella aukensis]